MRQTGLFAIEAKNGKIDELFSRCCHRMQCTDGYQDEAAFQTKEKIWSAASPPRPQGRVFHPVFSSTSRDLPGGHRLATQAVGMLVVMHGRIVLEADLRPLLPAQAGPVVHKGFEDPGNLAAGVAGHLGTKSRCGLTDGVPGEIVEPDPVADLLLGGLDNGKRAGNGKGRLQPVKLLRLSGSSLHFRLTVGFMGQRLGVDGCMGSFINHAGQV